jgi:hypothetical protein
MEQEKVKKTILVAVPTQMEKEYRRPHFLLPMKLVPTQMGQE